MRKKYPLEIENVGADTYMLMSRGHHDSKSFMDAVKEYRDWSMGPPVHVWFKAIPASPSYKEVIGWDTQYHECNPYTRGAFPATITVEAYGEDKYVE